MGVVADLDSLGIRDAGGFHMYRLDVRPGVEGGQVLRFLLRNPDFPRSVARCLSRARDPLRRLPRSKPILRSLEETRRTLARERVERLSPPEVRRFLERLLASIGRLHDEVEGAYFLPSPSGAEPRCAGARWGYRGRRPSGAEPRCAGARWGYRGRRPRGKDR